MPCPDMVKLQAGTDGGNFPEIQTLVHILARMD